MIILIVAHVAECITTMCDILDLVPGTTSVQSPEHHQVFSQQQWKI